MGVVDQSVDAKRQALQDAGDDASAQRRARGALYAEEVKVGSGADPHTPLTLWHGMAETGAGRTAESGSERADSRGHCA